MKNVFITLSTLVLTVGLFCTASAQDVDNAAVLKASQETLLSMPEPPLGCIVTKHPLVKGGKLFGFQVRVMKEGSASKVLITIEMSYDRSIRAARVAACKGYTNGLAASLQDAGFKPIDIKIPDIKKETFNKPVIVDMTLANSAGSQLFVHKRMFFTKKSYDVTVIATDKNDLESLSKWVSQIKPAAE